MHVALKLVSLVCTHLKQQSWTRWTCQRVSKGEQDLTRHHLFISLFLPLRYQITIGVTVFQ